MGGACIFRVIIVSGRLQCICPIECTAVDKAIILFSPEVSSMETTTASATTIFHQHCKLTVVNWGGYGWGEGGYFPPLGMSSSIASPLLVFPIMKCINYFLLHL